MAYTETLTYEALRSIDSSTFTGSYQKLGGPLLYPASIVKIVNNANVPVTISIDGTTDHDIAPLSTGFVYDNTTNRTSSTSGIFAPAGRQYYVKGSAGTGSVYLVVQYIQVVSIGAAP
jgi:hypothetical protein